MIGILLIIVVIVFFCTWNVYQHRSKKSYLYPIIATITLCGCIGTTILNFHNHLGMHLTTKQITYHIKPTSKQGNILIYKPLGTQKKNNVYLYHINNKHKIKHTKLDISNKNKLYYTNKHYGYIAQQRHKWVYTQQGKLWFSLMQRHGNTKDMITKIYVPKSWHVLTIHQAKLVKQNALKDAKQEKQQMQNPRAKVMIQQKVQQVIQTKLQKDPKQAVLLQSPRTKQQLIKSITKQLKHKMIKQAKQQIIQKAIQQAKNK